MSKEKKPSMEVEYPIDVLVAAQMKSTNHKETKCLKRLRVTIYEVDLT